MSTDSPAFLCPVCSQRLTSTVTPWTFYCGPCDYWGSSLAPVTTGLVKDDFLSQAEHDDVVNPIGHLDELRNANFRVIVREIAARKPTPTGPVLDVGCGPGLFLQAAAAVGITAVGIEPFEAMARLGRKAGCDIRLGLFPGCLAGDERFDAIVFNDVFEHLPDARAVLRVCLDHLVPGGLVVLNLPNSHGLFFRLAKSLARLGYRAPWERMWLKKFFSPHLHYWSPASLGKLCAAIGLDAETPPIALISVTRRGLWKRVCGDRSISLPVAVISYLGALCCSLVVPFFTSDSTLLLFRKPA